MDPAAASSFFTDDPLQAAGLLALGGALGGVAYAFAALLVPADPAAAPSPGARFLAEWPTTALRAVIGAVSALVVPVLPLEVGKDGLAVLGYAIVAGYGGPSLLASVWERFKGLTAQATLRGQLKEAQAQAEAATAEAQEAAAAVAEADAALAQAEGTAASPLSLEGTGTAVTAPRDRIAAARLALARVRRR